MRRKMGDTSLFIEEKGSGDLSLIFLHYWGGTHRTWSQVTDTLQKTCHTVAYDMRGWGQSDEAQSGYSIATLADEAATLVEQLGLQRYVLVGH